MLVEAKVGVHHHPRKVGRRGGASRRGGEAGSFSAAYEEACVSASSSGAASATEAFETRTTPADSNGVEALGWFSMKFGAALSIAGGSVTATLFLLQISPSSVLSSSSSSDTTLGAFLLAFLRGSFFALGGWKSGDDLRNRVRDRLRARRKLMGPGYGA